LNVVGAQSGWKCTGMPPPLPHAYLVGAFAAGAPAGLGRGDLEPRRDLVIIGATLYSWGPGGRRGERNRARTAKARARMNPVVITTTLACRYARGSHPQGHMERVGRPPFGAGLYVDDDIIAHELARIHVSYYNDGAKRTKGMYRQRIQKAWGHAAHRGWARLLLDRTRDLIIHGTAHRGANGAAMPTDEDDQDGHFLSNHPERGDNFAAA